MKNLTKHASLDAFSEAQESLSRPHVALIGGQQKSLLAYGKEGKPFTAHLQGQSALFPLAGGGTEGGDQPTSPYQAIDLGLPSGLKWAKCNLGAETAGDAGLYFAWGETTGFENGSGHVFDNATYTARDISANLTLAQDAANVLLGGNWRMPTKEDNLELCANCFAEWTTNYDGTGKAGVIFYSTTSNATGKGYYKGESAWKRLNGTSYTDASQPGGFVAYTLATPHIFIPAAGYFSGSTSLSSEGSAGFCWSSSLISASNCYTLNFNTDGVYPQSRYGSLRYAGIPVRAVLAE